MINNESHKIDEQYIYETWKTAWAYNFNKYPSPIDFSVFNLLYLFLNSIVGHIGIWLKIKNN